MEVQAPERLDKLTRHLPGMLYQFLRRPDGSCCFPYSSDGIQAIYGFTAEQVCDDAEIVFERIHPDDVDAVRSSIAASEASGEPWHAEYRVCLPSGETIWVAGLASPEPLDDGSVLWHGFIQDISERKAAQQGLEIAERRFRQLAESISEVFWLASPQRFIYVNSVYERISGRSLAQLNEDPRDFFRGVHPDDVERVIEAVRQDWAGVAYLDETYRVVHSSGEVRWVHTRSFPVDGEPGLRAGVSSDITLARRAEEKLQRMASIDRLTRAWNRQRGEAELDDLLALAERYQRPFAVVLFDLDRFKQVNDRFGHQAGDAVLQEVCERTTRQLRRHDRLIRWGGEEFLLLLPETTDDGAQVLAERVREAVADPQYAEVGTVTISLGVTAWRPGDDAKAMLRRVDRALYRAKDQGRNRTELAGDLD